jgi:hypothetical protein
LSNTKLREDLSQEVRREQESMQQSLPSQELRDFIQRIVVPILVDRHLEERRRDTTRRLRQSVVHDSPAITNKASIEPRPFT